MLPYKSLISFGRVQVVGTLLIVCALDVKQVASELSGSFAKLGVPQADSNSSNPPGNFHKTFFLLKVLIEKHNVVIVNYLINLS